MNIVLWWVWTSTAEQFQESMTKVQAKIHSTLNLTTDNTFTSWVNYRFESDPLLLSYILVHV